MSKRLAIVVMTVFAVSSLIASFLILYHQKVTFGTWFQFDQVLHHEFFALFFFALGIGIIVGAVFFAVIERL